MSRRKQQLKYVIADVLSAVLVWLCFLLFRWMVYEGRVFGMDTILIPAFGFVRPLILYPVCCLVIYYLSGYYLHPFRKSFWKELLTTFICAGIIAIGAFYVIIIDDPVSQYKHYLVSLAVLFVLQFIVSYLPRLLISTFQNRHHIEPEKVIIPRMEDDNALYRAIAAAYPSGKEIYVEPRLYDIVTGAAHIGELNQNPYICITDQTMSDAGLCIKRAADVVLALGVMIVLSPLYLVLSVLIYAGSPGPVLYRQERIGRYGRAFTILKFRTMQLNAEPQTPLLSSDNDPRVTPIGKWMRRYRLDELPQMWNILRGDMSWVGPRPERAFFIDQIMQQAPYYCLIYNIRPGMTSWGPIKVGYTDTLEKMIQRLNYDIAYMSNMSLGLDLKILFYTIGVILDGKGK